MRLTSGFLICAITIAGIGFAPAEADAQSEGRFALGLGASGKWAADESADAESRGVIVWRIGHGRQGWGMNFGLNWYTTDLNQPIGGVDQDFGRLRVRPIMAGYGYAVRMGPVWVSTALLGGYSINSFSRNSRFEEIYGSVNGADAVRASVSNAWVVKPEVSAWIDLSRKVGMYIGTGYLVARPEATIESSLGDEHRRIRADVYILTVGAAYSVF